MQLNLLHSHVYCKSNEQRDILKKLYFFAIYGNMAVSRWRQRLEGGKIKNRKNKLRTQNHQISKLPQICPGKMTFLLDSIFYRLGKH